MQTQTLVRNVALAASLALLGAHTASAQDARSIIQKMSAVYTNAKTYQATMQMDMTMGAMGTMSMTSDIKSLGNQKFSVKTSPGKNNTGQMAMGAAMMNSQVIDDGKNMYMYMPAMNRYMKMPHMAGAAGKSGMGGMGFGGGMMPGDIKADKGTYKLLPSTAVNGRPVYVVAYTPPASTPSRFQGSFTLYIDKSTYHLKQMKMSTSMPGQPTKMNMTMTYANEKMNAPIPASTFVFTPPKGAVEMQGGAGMMGGSGMMGGH